MATDLAAELGGGLGPAGLAKALRTLADRHPYTVRRWLEEHPANLMTYHGWRVEPFHRRALNAALINREILWLAPRGSGKSTAYVFLAVWLAIANPDVYTDARYTEDKVPYLFPEAGKTIGPHNIRIALTGNAADKAVGLAWQAKAILASQEMSKLFGGPLAGKRWKDLHADTRLRTEKLREGTLNAMGLGSSVTGGHYDVVVPDDWVTEDNARTELQRRRLADFWNMTVAPTREPWARTFAAGTRYHPHDWYAAIREWERRGMWGKVLIDKALDGDPPASYWPEVYPLTKLAEIRAQIGEIAFQTQYQNEVDVLLGDFFLRQWMENYCRWDSLPMGDRQKAVTTVALDPAIKAGPRNDYSVFCVTSFIPPLFYVRRVLRGQWTMQELVERASLLNQQYQPQTFAVEVVQGQEWLVQELRRRVSSIPLKEMRPQQFKGKDKVGRASYIRKFLENGQVFFEEPTPDNGIQRLAYEALAFPTAEGAPGMDDCVDAFVWSLLAATMPRTRLISLRNRRRI